MAQISPEGHPDSVYISGPDGHWVVPWHQLSPEQQQAYLQGILDSTAHNNQDVSGSGHHRSWSKKDRPDRCGQGGG